MINFSSKVTPARMQRTTANLQMALESDRGRIINSAAIRRLQQKTQVFPLERNAAVRSRLTHSLEVQQVGRFIVQRIFANLNYQQQKEYERSRLRFELGRQFGHLGTLRGKTDGFRSERYPFPVTPASPVSRRPVLCIEQT